MTASAAALTLVEPETSPPLSPARAILAQAITSLRAAQGRFKRESAPAAALDTVIAAADRADRELAELRVEREERVGEWLAGGSVGERPAPSKDETRAEHAARRARADADAAERVRAAAYDRRNSALAALNQAVALRDNAWCAAAVAAVREVVDAELVPAVERVLAIEARLRGVQSALADFGNRRGLNAALGAAGTVGELIRGGRSAGGVPRDDAAGRQFLDRLFADAAATL